MPKNARSRGIICHSSSHWLVNKTHISASANCLLSFYNSNNDKICILLESLFDQLTYIVIICYLRYYQSHKEVQRDTELQNFARDVSVGSGKVRWLTSIREQNSILTHLLNIRDIFASRRGHQQREYL